MTKRKHPRLPRGTNGIIGGLGLIVNGEVMLTDDEMERFEQLETDPDDTDDQEPAA